MQLLPLSSTFNRLAKDINPAICKTAKMSLFLYSEPSHHLGSLGRTHPDDFSSLFEHGPMKNCVRDSQAVANTAVDVKETPEAFHFVADLPGLKREEVKVQVEENNVLTISGDRIREKKQRTDTYHRLERSSGKFLRRFGLPSNADVAKISAKCEDGVLSVTVPKIPPRQPEKSKVIDVQIS